MATKDAWTILGVACTLRRSEDRKVLRQVLTRIERAAPRDFERLRVLVRRVGPYPEWQPGDLAIWELDQPQADDQETWDWGLPGGPGVVKVAPFVRGRLLVAVLAHELGHAATRLEDLRRRGAVGDEWASEFCADWYACKWGFSRELRSELLPIRYPLHHGPWKGRTFGDRVGDEWVEHRVSRNFVSHVVSRRPLTDADFVSYKHSPSE